MFAAQRVVRFLVLTLAIAATPAAALADEFVDRANRLTRLIPGNQSLEAELFPAMAQMQNPPGDIPSRLSNLRLMALIGPGHPVWSRVSQWAAAEPQQNVLEVLKEATDPDRRSMISLPLGREGVDPEWVSAGLFVELGPDDLLAPLTPHYLERFKTVHMLVVWDAMRLAEDGDPDAGLDGYLALLRFYRTVMDRPTRSEQTLAYELMGIALEHLRDFAHRYRSEGLTSRALIDFVSSIEEDEINILRTKLPEVPAVLGDQLLERVYEYQGEVRVDAFAETMARLAAAQDPLSTFNAAANYRVLAGLQRDWFDAAEQIDTVIGDFRARFAYDLEDIYHVTVPTDYSLTNLNSYAVVRVVAEDLDRFVPYKRAIKTHLAGTRVALGIVAYMIDNDQRVPPTLISIQPRYIDDLSKNLDMFGYDYDELEAEELLFFEPRNVAARLEGGNERVFGELSPTERRRLMQLDKPHKIDIFYPFAFDSDVPGLFIDGLPGGARRNTLDWTALYERAGGVVATGPTAQFNPNWNSGDDDDSRGRSRVDRSIVGQPAPPLLFYDAFATPMDANNRRGEILVVMPGTATGEGGSYGFYADIFERIGRRFHFDGVRVVIRAGDFAEAEMSEIERQLMAANYARQIPISLYFIDEDEARNAVGAWDIGLDDQDQDAFIVDRNGIVRAAGIEFRFIEAALIELLKEQPSTALLNFGPDKQAAAQRSRAMQLVPAPVEFIAEVDRGEFVLYSRGINRRDDNPAGAEDPQPVDATGRELLFWPPVLSLQRMEMD